VWIPVPVTINVKATVLTGIGHCCGCTRERDGNSLHQDIGVVTVDPDIDPDGYLLTCPVTGKKTTVPMAIAGSTRYPVVGRYLELRDDSLDNRIDTDTSNNRRVRPGTAGIKDERRDQCVVQPSWQTIQNICILRECEVITCTGQVTPVKRFYTSMRKSVGIAALGDVDVQVEVPADNSAHTTTEARPARVRPEAIGQGKCSQ
jgi:hypothetical protein